MITATVRTRFAALLSVALAAFLATAGSAAAFVVTPSTATMLNPLIGGTFLNGTGASSQWVQVQENWRGTIHGAESWGTGIWGLADANQVLGLGAGNPDVVARHNGLAGPIHFADQLYLDKWSATWGTQDLAPILDPAPRSYQENWAVRFTGYISITDPGLYNFSVLYDDGFSFNLFGANGALSLLKDGLNPRERLGFDSDLDLLEGLYGFQLTAWERLEAGVVSLDWIRPDGQWEPVPRSHLFNSIPAPTTALLLAPGLAVLAARRRAAGA